MIINQLKGLENTKSNLSKKYFYLLEVGRGLLGVINYLPGRLGIKTRVQKEKKTLYTLGRHA